MKEWFGIVRWCEEDLIAGLVDNGFPATENNVGELLCHICNDHGFCDHMIAAGWDYIQAVIYDLHSSGLIEDYGEDC